MAYFFTPTVLGERHMRHIDIFKDVPREEELRSMDWPNGLAIGAHDYKTHYTSRRQLRKLMAQDPAPKIGETAPASDFGIEGNGWYKVLAKHRWATSWDRTYTSQAVMLLLNVPRPSGYRIVHTIKYDPSQHKTQYVKSRKLKRGQPVTNAFNSIRRDRRIRNATPRWVIHSPHITSQLKDLERKRTAMNKEAGFVRWHVDHLVPIYGVNHGEEYKELECYPHVVSGLHVPWNLMIIPAVDNLVKSNKWPIC